MNGNIALLWNYFSRFSYPLRTYGSFYNDSAQPSEVGLTDRWGWRRKSVRVGIPSRVAIVLSPQGRGGEPKVPPSVMRGSVSRLGYESR